MTPDTIDTIYKTIAFLTVFVGVFVSLVDLSAALRRPGQRWLLLEQPTSMYEMNDVIPGFVFMLLGSIFAALLWPVLLACAVVFLPLWGAAKAVSRLVAPDNGEKDE